MKKKKLLISFSALTVVLLIFAMLTLKKKEESIDLQGSNSFCTASLNIHTGYDCELILNPKEETPRIINVTLKIKDKSVYNTALEYTDNSNPDFLGSYSIKFEDTLATKIKNNDDIELEISFDDESSILKLKDKIVYSMSTEN